MFSGLVFRRVRAYWNNNFNKKDYFNMAVLLSKHLMNQGLQLNQLITTTLLQSTQT